MAKLEVIEVAPGIWRVRRGRGGSAVYIVQMSPGAVLVDAGPDETGVDVMHGLQAARVGLNSIRAILLTHSHPHAASGARVLQERSGARLVQASSEPGPTIERYFDVLPTPGHTESHVALLFRPTRTLFAGDALRALRGGVGLSRGTEDRTAARESMRACLAAEPSLVLPCHGPPLFPAAGGGLSARRTR
jgi:glyoxylase-like metal-dependent hydrolase (beta-lactamase superfamily II)